MGTGKQYDEEYKKQAVELAKEIGSGMGKTNEKLKASCPGAALLQGKVLNGVQSETVLSEWIENLDL